MASRGCGRVTSQTDTATGCPGRTTARSGGPATGWRSASRSVAGTSGTAGWYAGATTVVRSAGSEIRRPWRP